MKSQIYQIASVLTVLLSFVPAVIVLLKKLWQVIPFNFFAIYWVVNGIVNTILLFKDALNKKVIEAIIVTYNSLDIPMIVGVIYFSAFSPRLMRFIRVGISLFILFEIGSLVHGGFHYESLKYVMGVGVVFIMTIIIWQISLYLQQMEHAAREKALILIHGALLFQYGTYIVVYIFDFYLPRFADNVDKYLIYYISTIISIVVGSSGLLLNGLRRLSSTAAIRKTFWAESQDRRAG